MIKKRKFILFPALIFSLVSCNKSVELKSHNFYFATYTEIRLYEGENNDLENMDKIFSKIDRLTDNYLARDLANIFTINNTSENVEIEPELFEVLNLCFSTEFIDVKTFNPLCGNLAKKWKNSLENGEILDEITINEELEKMATSSLDFVGENIVKKVGEAELDLGAVAKGFALDKIKEYLDSKNYKKYLVDAGSSSLLLGEKEKGKNYRVKIDNLDNKYLELKNCFISTSSNSKQNKVIEGKTYSHIINPTNGSAINKYDAVIVISNKGYLGDILSTAFVNEEIDKIKNLEEKFNVKSIVIKDRAIVYKNAGIEVVD